MAGLTGRIRGRFGRAIDWRVQVALQQQVQSAVDEAVSRHLSDLAHKVESDHVAIESIIDDLRRRVEDMITHHRHDTHRALHAYEEARQSDRKADRTLLEDRLDDFHRAREAELADDRDALESLRSLVRTLSSELVDQQRAQMELLEDMNRRLGHLEARPYPASVSTV